MEKPGKEKNWKKKNQDKSNDNELFKVIFFFQICIHHTALALMKECFPNQAIHLSLNAY